MVNNRTKIQVTSTFLEGKPAMIVAALFICFLGYRWWSKRNATQALSMPQTISKFEAMCMDQHKDALKNPKAFGGVTLYCNCIAKETVKNSGILYKKFSAKDNHKIDDMITKWMASKTGKASIQKCQDKGNLAIPK